MRSPTFSASRVTVVGVLNVTPDSFSDGGRLGDVDAVVARALAMERDGAHVLDVGGESTRPGAVEVPAAEEIARVVPAIEALAKSTRLPISIDTRKAAVARAAIAAGARVVNDVSGGRHDPALLAVAAEHEVDLVLGHLRGTPATMQTEPCFTDVVSEVIEELAQSIERARAHGVRAERLCVDPGIGFGKELPHNLALLAQVGTIAARLGRPVLVGPSRKSFLGRLTGDAVGERDTATVAACAVAVFAGANAIRVHDVRGGVRAAVVGAALRNARTASAEASA
jgi:dihydropteroate synthase